MADRWNNLISLVTGGNTTSLAPTVETINPEQNVYYTSLKKPGATPMADVITRIEEKRLADTQARVHELNQGRPACPAGFFGLGFANGPIAGSHLPGVFDVLGVPFSVGELKSTGAPDYVRTYVPGILQRYEAAIAVWRSSMRYVKHAAQLNDDFTINPGHFGADYPTGKEGDTEARAFSLKRFIEMMNSPVMQDRIVEDLTTFVTDEAYHGERPHYVLTENLPNFPLPSVRPTQAEWEENGGAYRFFERGGFIIDKGVAEGRRWLHGGHPGSIGACAAWCRGARPNGFPNDFPSGYPYCQVPVSLDRPDIRGWVVKIDMVSIAPRYRLTVAPAPRGSFSQAVNAVAGAIEGALHSLCDHDDTAAKAAATLIAFTKAQGATAQAAAAKAKTPAEKANAAALIQRYNALSLELTLAVTVANVWCKANPALMASLPPTELPAVEPPVNKKFNFDDIMDGIKVKGVYGLSPESAASPVRWSAAAIAGLALIGAAGGAIAYSRKRS